MKQIMLVMLIAASVLSAQRATAQTGACEKEVDVKAVPVVASRGKDLKIKIDVKAGQRMYLKSASLKSRGKAPKCMISLYNELEKEVDVFVDGAYIGSLRANTQGVIETLAKYETVYCVSTDKKSSWSEKGDCSCVYIFKLKN